MGGTTSQASDFASFAGLQQVIVRAVVDRPRQLGVRGERVLLYVVGRAPSVGGVDLGVERVDVDGLGHGRAGPDRGQDLGGMTPPVREVRHVVLRAPFGGVGGKGLAAEPVQLDLALGGRGQRLEQALLERLGPSSASETGVRHHKRTRSAGPSATIEWP